MSSKAKLSPRKEELFLTGKSLILSKGFTATTVDEIVENVGVTKGAFYYFFKSKVAFAQELLEYNWSPVRESQATLSDSNTDPLKHLHQHIDFMIKFIPNEGRLMGILSQELSETNPQMAEQVRGYFADWTQYLQHLIEVTKARYAPDAGFDSQNLMEFIIMNIEGSPIVSRQLGQEALEHAVTHLKYYLNTLFQAEHN
jgi:TetR/AcrR family transcriptional regulator, transcriptional repressor for nem operon